MKTGKIYLLLILMAFNLSYSCSPSSEERASSEKAIQDSLAAIAEQMEEAEQAMRDSMIASTKNPSHLPADSASTEPGRNPASEEPATSASPDDETEPALPAKGSLAFFCPRKMLERTANHVTVTISVADVNKALETIRTQAAAADNSLSAQTIQAGAEAHTIRLWSKMKVELKYSTDDFIVIDKPETDEQTFVNTDMLEWSWLIEPTHIGESEIYLTVKGYDEESKRWIVAHQPALYKIKIEIDKRSYFSKLWIFFKLNPEWLLAQVVLPFITFIAGRKTKT